MKKILDRRLRALIEHGVASHHRSIFVVCGKRAKDQVVIIHYMLSKAMLDRRPRVLWCYDKELGFSTHRMKRMRRIQKRLKTVGSVANEMSANDPFHLFVASTQIRWCYYRETERILGQTFEMLVLQDFEGLNANLLARTIETVSGGGICVLIVPDHRLFIIDQTQSRFSRRFLKSLQRCEDCVLLLTDTLDPLPFTPALKLKPPKLQNTSLDGLIENANVNIRQFLELCKTECQLKAFVDIINNFDENHLEVKTAFIIAGRGRGKSALMGISLACLVVLQELKKRFKKIIVSAPSPYNLSTFFEFLVFSLEKIGLEKTKDFEITSTRPIPSNVDEALAKETPATITRVELKSRSVVVQYVEAQATEFDKVMLDGLMPDLIRIDEVDEAAAIPLPFVKNLIFQSSCPVMLASTVSGYEGTGRSLSLKLATELNKRKLLLDVKLKEPIRYGKRDPVEHWLNKLLFLDCNEGLQTLGTLPPHDKCKLYEVNRDLLLSGHPLCEKILRFIISIYASAHYKNSPNDIQLLADSPHHRLFVLMARINMQILCVVQIALEGKCRLKSDGSLLNRGNRPGDLLPYTLSQQFSDDDFVKVPGARIVRIATHPDAQRNGYGQLSVKLLIDHLEGDQGKDTEPPDCVFSRLRFGYDVQYVGVSFGLSRSFILNNRAINSSDNLYHQKVSSFSAFLIFEYWPQSFILNNLTIN
ncbi:hypothetical protein ACOME3_000414 [Neoechinorhynchus agilis]